MTQSSLLFIPDLNKVQQKPGTLAISLTYNIGFSVQRRTESMRGLSSGALTLTKQLAGAMQRLHLP
ncbi:MAG: hypothetical protein KME46_11365 [Brasilonema angustatum HA4187-MV1]|jgi:hypothetical protein|nr:hypothetical protein [Brasilonema angustatum HA4187-MV1]